MRSPSHAADRPGSAPVLWPRPPCCSRAARPSAGPASRRQPSPPAPTPPPWSTKIGSAHRLLSQARVLAGPGPLDDLPDDLRMEAEEHDGHGEDRHRRGRRSGPRRS
ncbi:MAG: hypothetical protein MZU79_07270 [Anaerotruncus sp.]|nr:hypothetical protein [Anaerotruncus sp.]